MQSRRDELWCPLMAEMRTTFKRQCLEKIKSSSTFLVHSGCSYGTQLLSNKFLKVLNSF